MEENKAEVQALVKHLLERPDEVKSFQNNPKILFEKFKIVDIDGKLNAKIIAVIKDFGKSLEDGQYSHYSDNDFPDGSHGDGVHYNFTEFNFDSKIKTAKTFDRAIKDLIGRLIANESDLKTFQKDPNVLFKEYGITPKQELVSLINSALLVGNQATYFDHVNDSYVDHGYHDMAPSFTELKQMNRK